MKSPFRKNNPIAAAETALAHLGTRRETLEARKVSAIAKLEAARSARKHALAGDPDAELAGLIRAVRDDEDELETLTGVLADLSEEVAAAEARLAEARDADVRAAAAKTLEAVAVSVDNAAADLERGLAIVGKAYAALVAAVPETLKVVDLDERVPPPERSRSKYPVGVFGLEDHRQNALPNDLARAVLAEGIAKVCPMAFGADRTGFGWNLALSRAGKIGSEYPSFCVNDLAGMSVKHSAVEAATLLVSGRLRDRARHIVAGDMSPNLEDAPIFRPEPKLVRVPDVEVYALDNFAFQIAEGKATQLVAKWWVRQIPEDAANVAVAANVALRTDTPEGAAVFEERKAARAKYQSSSGSGYLSRDMCHDLGVIRKAPEPVDLTIANEAVAA